MARRLHATPLAALSLCVAAGLALSFSLTVPVTHAQAQDTGRRLALVIGNDSYAASPLKNARNDARAIAGALKDLGFVVTPVLDASRQQIGDAVAAFTSSLKANDIALFYYAGHGLQIDGENYLIPVDFSAAGSAAQVRFNGVKVGDIQQAMRGAQVSVLILDACRNNPFSGARAGSGGLAPMEARGSLVAFATAAYETASDTDATGLNGLFTAELLKVLREPEVPLREVFFRVRRGVYEASFGKQFPSVYDNLLGDVVLRSRGAAAAVVVTPAPAPVSAVREPAIDVASIGKAGRAIAGTLTPQRQRQLTQALVGATDGVRRGGPAPAALPFTWVQTHALKSTEGKAYMILTLAYAAPRAGSNVAVYIRAVAKSAAPAATSYAWESQHVKKSQSAGLQTADMALSLAPGDYSVYVAAAVDDATPATAVITKDLTVPSFDPGDLTTSSIIVATEVVAVTGAAAPTPQQQADDPFFFSGVRIVPSLDGRFPKSSEIALAFWIYGATAENDKPNVTVAYNFFARGEKDEKYFNRTAPQQFDTQTLPPAFSLKAGHPISGGVAVPLASFAAGEYRVEITITDNFSKRSVVKSATFSVTG